MTDSKNNALLEKLVQYAKTIGNKQPAPLTAERFFVALIDTVDETCRLDSGEDVSGALKLMTDAGLDLKKCKQVLMEYINSSQSAFLDDLYMKKKLNAASLQAQEKQKQLAPEDLVRSILDDPSAVLRRCMEGTASNDQQPEGADMPANKALEAFLKERQAAAEKASGEKERKPRMDAEPALPPKQQVAKLTERVKQIHNTLSDIVFGQDKAVSVFSSGYFQAQMQAMTEKNRTRPGATYLFAGPPGVGKTFLAESAAKILDLPFMRFDMSEYCTQEAAVEFCGSDSVYRNSKEGNFTAFISKNPKAVVLFDEIEKAHTSIIHLFLQILDAGRIRDNNTDREYSLKDVIMIFTTNAGRQLYKDSENGDFSSVSRKVILKALQNDINPLTGSPYFPAAICSRFASGNVVMFNQIAAHDLCSIAKREVLRRAQSFEKEIGVKVDIDERVYTALMFAEGGTADARTVRSRAAAFFDEELFELFRLTSVAASDSAVEDIETIRVDVELPADDPQVAELFLSKETPNVLIFASEQLTQQCAQMNPECNFIRADTVEQADAALRNQDVKVVLIDLVSSLTQEKKYLNIEDAESAARDFFRHACQLNSGVPLYLLQTKDYTFHAEEERSFLRQGARGIISVGDDFALVLNRVCDSLHQQQSMKMLASSNRLVTYETAQYLADQGKTAGIKLFDFQLSTAMEAEDAGNVMSNVSRPNVTFDQVIGAEDAKKELMYFVEYLRNPRRYLGTGVRAPKGVLLYGPPGTGKTMLAKAMAKESNVTFINAEGNQFLKKYVGEGPEKVHELFNTARKYAPAILFIDEIDAIAKERTGEAASGVEATLTAFLAEMDGFKNDESRPVFVLAATNFDVEPGSRKSLDPALMRRFDRRVYIDLPDREARVLFMKRKIAGNKAFQISDEKIQNLAIRSTGMSLANLDSAFELSLRMTIREGSTVVTDELLDEAFETFNSGEKKVWNESVLERVARHEAGHAFLCWHSGEMPSYVTVVPRANHGGYMRHGDDEDRPLYTRQELLAKIRTSLGGRAAELVYYGKEDGLSTGASGDLASATRLARGIVCTYGMDDVFGLAVIDRQDGLGTDMPTKVREAVNKILSEQLNVAVDVIRENHVAMDRLVEALLRKNHLTAVEIEAVLGPCPK